MVRPLAPQGLVRSSLLVLYACLEQNGNLRSTFEEIKGRSAFFSDIEGTLPSDGTRYHFRNTIIEGDMEIIVVSVWTPAANYTALIKEQLDAVPSGVGGI